MRERALLPAKGGLRKGSGELPTYISAGEVEDVLSSLALRAHSVQLSAFQRSRSARLHAFVRFL